MTDVQREKECFVQHELRDLLKAIDSNILTAEYRVTPTGEEYVYITWFRDEERDYTVKRNVTGNSLIAITRDVLEVVE